MRKIIWVGVLAAAVAVAAGPARAQNLGPPLAPNPGSEILNLNGQAATIAQYDTSTGYCLNKNCGYQTYSAIFTVPANSTGLTTLTFAFRNDPGYFGFSDVTLTQVGGPSTNLIALGQFESGAASVNTSNSAYDLAPSCPAGIWCGFNQGAGQAGAVVTNGGVSGQPNGSGLSWPTGSYFWQDGATQQYDGLYQNVVLIAGTTYQVTFGLENIDANLPQYDGNNATGLLDACSGTATYTTYQNASTNGDTSDICGNGVNVTAYVGYPGLPSVAQPYVPSPEPATLALFGSGLFGLGLLRRRWH